MYDTSEVRADFILTLDNGQPRIINLIDQLTNPFSLHTWHHRAPCWQRLAQHPAGQASAPGTSQGSGAPKKNLKGLSHAMDLAFDEICD